MKVSCKGSGKGDQEAHSRAFLAGIVHGCTSQFKPFKTGSSQEVKFSVSLSHIAHGVID